MSDRSYAAMAVLVALAVLGYAAERVGVIRLPWQPAPEAAPPSAPLQPTWRPDPGTGYPPAAQPAAAPAQAAAKPAAKPAAPTGWRALRDEALAAYQALRYQEALDACGKAVAAAAQAGTANHALALVTCGGLPGLQRRNARQLEDWLKLGVAMALKLEQGAIIAALGPREAMLKERGLRMLGEFYLEQKRPREAAANFALAVDTVRAMPPPETSEQRLALRADLLDLGLVLAQLGLRGTARQALGEARDYYLKTEPGHAALKTIDSALQALEEPVKEPAK